MSDYKDTPRHDRRAATACGFITIRVPGGKQCFTVHKTMIARRFKYFRNKLTLEPTRTIFDLTLPHTTEETLHHYMLYLYSGIIQCQGHGDDADREDADCRWRLIDFYGLASHLNDGGAMDAAISGMIASVHEGDVPKSEPVKKAYAVAPPGSPLRKLMVDMHVWGPNAAKLSDKDDKAFLLDVAKASFHKLAGFDEGHWNANAAAASCCDYHQHAEGAACLSKKRKRDDEDDEPESEEGEEDELKEGTPVAKKFRALQAQVEELQKKLDDLSKNEWHDGHGEETRDSSLM